MKKIVLLALCFAMLAGMMTAVGAATTTLVNDTGDGTGNWYLRDHTAGTDSLGNISPGADGTGKCLRLINPNGKVLLLGRNGAQVTYKKGYTYTISWKMKTADANETVYLCFFNNIMNTTPAVISHAKVGGTTGKYTPTTSWQNYSCTFTVEGFTNGSTSSNGQPLTFRINSGGTLFLDDIVIKETPAFLTTVTVGENGTVTRNNAAIDAPFYVTEGQSVTLDLTPNENYLPKVKVNGADYPVTNNQVTLTVNETTNIAVTFEEIPDVAPGFAGDDTSYSIFEEVDGMPTIFTYHKLNEFNTGETGLEYGVKLWNNANPENKVTLAAHVSETETAKAVPGAQFAIRAYGKAITEENTYGIQPYVGEVLGESEILSYE